MPEEQKLQLASSWLPDPTGAASPCPPGPPADLHGALRARWSRWWRNWRRQPAWHRGEVGVCGLFPVPAAFRQKPPSSERLPSSAFVCRTWPSLFILRVPLRFFQRRGNTAFSSESQRDLSGKQNRCTAKKENNLWRRLFWRRKKKHNKTTSLGLDTPLATGTANTAPQRGVKKRLCSAVSSEIACQQSAASRGDTRPRTPSPSPSPSGPPTCKALSSPELQHPSAALLLLPHELPWEHETNQAAWTESSSIKYNNNKKEM